MWPFWATLYIIRKAQSQRITKLQPISRKVPICSEVWQLSDHQGAPMSKQICPMKVLRQGQQVLFYTKCLYLVSFTKIFNFVVTHSLSHSLSHSLTHSLTHPLNFKEFKTCAAGKKVLICFTKPLLEGCISLKTGNESSLSVYIVLHKTFYNEYHSKITSVWPKKKKKCSDPTTFWSTKNRLFM